MQRWHFPRCPRQNSTALYLWRHHLRRNLTLWANPSPGLIHSTPGQMTTASLMWLCRCQRTIALLGEIGIQTRLRKWGQLSLLSQLVQANLDKFAPCHREWWNPCPIGISMETKVCTTWHLKLLLVIQMKISSTMPIFNFRANEKPYHVPCRNDGWYYVSSTSTTTAWCEGICPSGHQRCQWTHGLQQLDAPEAKQSSWGCPDSPFSMVPTMQTQPHNKQSQITQGQVEHTWQKASLQNELFWDIRPHCHMVRHQAYDHLRNHFLLGPLTSGLWYDISTSSNQDGHLHGIATRDSNKAWEF
jgi:hypothetical protein